MSGMSINISGRCESLIAEATPCHGCAIRPAVGHAQMRGGPYDGRIIAVLCEECMGGNAETASEAVRRVLIGQAMVGLFEPSTGGPGPNGAPTVVHGDHEDEL